MPASGASPGWTSARSLSKWATTFVAFAVAYTEQVRRLRTHCVSLRPLAYPLHPILPSRVVTNLRQPAYAGCSRRRAMTAVGVGLNSAEDQHGQEGYGNYPEENREVGFEPPPPAAAWWCTPRGAENPPAKAATGSSSKVMTALPRMSPARRGKTFENRRISVTPLSAWSSFEHRNPAAARVCGASRPARAGNHGRPNYRGRCQCGRRHPAASPGVNEGASGQRRYGCRSSPAVVAKRRSASAFVSACKLACDSSLKTRCPRGPWPITGPDDG